jgi:hypothetical protein
MEGLLFPIVCIIAVFSYLAIEAWADARRREREAYYHTIAFLISVAAGQCQNFERGLAKNATETFGRQSH